MINEQTVTYKTMCMEYVRLEPLFRLSFDAPCGKTLPVSEKPVTVPITERRHD